MAHPSRVHEILEAGAVRARIEAEATMERVRDAMGLVWRDSLPTH
jgi:hypothetical protein